MLHEVVIRELGDDVANGVKVVAAKRLPGRDGNPGIVKVALDSLESKKTVLRAKSKIKESQKFQNVWIRGSMTHAERLIHINFKKILQVLPGGGNYRISGSGRVIEKNNNEETYAKVTSGGSGNAGGRERGHNRGRDRGRGRGRGDRT